MKLYQLKLDNSLVDRAYDQLRVGELYTYIHLVFAIKNGISAEHSKRYCLNDELIYSSLLDYGYKKSVKTFRRHKGTLLKNKLINEGIDKHKFIDVIHRHSEALKSNFTLIDFQKLTLALGTLDQQGLKAFIGMERKKSYLESKKVWGRLKSKTRLEKKVLNFSNRKRFYSARKQIKDLQGQNGNCVIALSDHIQTRLGQNGNHNKKKSAFKEINKPAASPIDFKSFDLNMKVLNIINKIRRSEKRREFSKTELQGHIDQFEFAKIRKLIRPIKSFEALFVAHLKKFKTPILSDEHLSEYYVWLETGKTKTELQQEENIVGKDLFVPEEVEESTRDKFLSLDPKKDESRMAIEYLVSKNPVFSSMLGFSEDLKEKCGFYNQLTEQILAIRENSQKKYA